MRGAAVVVATRADGSFFVGRCVECLRACARGPKSSVIEAERAEGDFVWESGRNYYDSSVPLPVVSIPFRAHAPVRSQSRVKCQPTATRHRRKSQHVYTTRHVLIRSTCARVRSSCSRASPLVSHYDAVRRFSASRATRSARLCCSTHGASARFGSRTAFTGVQSSVTPWRLPTISSRDGTKCHCATCGSCGPG